MSTTLVITLAALLIQSLSVEKAPTEPVLSIVHDEPTEVPAYNRLQYDSILEVEFNQQATHRFDVEPAANAGPAEQNDFEAKFEKQAAPQAENVNVRSGTPADITPTMIEGTRLLEMTPEELKQLGITADAHELRCYYSGLTPGYYTYKNMNKRILLAPSPVDHPDDTLMITFSNTNEFARSWFAAPVEDMGAAGFNTPRIVPLCIMSFYGEHVSFWYLADNEDADAIFARHGRSAKDRLDDDGNLVEQSLKDPVLDIQTLLPIHFQLGAGAADTVPALDVVLWYKADQEFIDLLPERIADDLEKEREILTSVADSDAPRLEEGLTGEAYFDVWRSRSSAITLEALYPNPAGSNAVATLHVREQRQLTVSLRDIFGREVAHVGEISASPGYRGTIDIDTSDKPSGIYLLAVTSDAGEQLVQRLIVRH